MSAYPVAYDQSPPVKRSRLTVFFRLLLIIPHLIWALLYGIAVFVVVVIAWFAILFTGRYPAGMYEFAAGYLRFYTRLNGYCYLVVDSYPPFDGGEHPEYPARAQIGAAQASYSRLKALFRLILAIPILILLYVFQIWLEVVAIAIWLVAVVTGPTPAGLTDAMRFPMSYSARAAAYLFLMTDIYTPVSDTETLPHLSPPAT